MVGKEIKGGYFTYCQWCSHDGNCELGHNEFMGTKASGEVDKTPYPGHEDLSWHLTAFSEGSRRSTCSGRIFATDDMYFPLACECGTVISSLFGKMCAKFKPSEKGEERLRIAKEIARRKNVSLAEVSPEELPEPDPRYKAVMER